MFSRFLSWHIHFRGILPADGILPGANLIFASKSCVLLYWQHYCTALDHWASAKLCCMVQGMELLELSEMAPPIFGWAAITLDIGPYSSYRYIGEARIATFPSPCIRLLSDLMSAIYRVMK